MWRSGGQMAERILQRFQESRRRRRSPSNINECNLPSFLNTSHSLLTVWKNLSAKSGPTGNNHHICDMFNNLLRTALENKNDTLVCSCIISTSCTPLKTLWERQLLRVDFYFQVSATHKVFEQQQKSLIVCEFKSRIAISIFCSMWIYNIAAAALQAAKKLPLGVDQRCRQYLQKKYTMTVLISQTPFWKKFVSWPEKHTEGHSKNPYRDLPNTPS